MNTHNFGCQCPEISLSEASTQVNEEMIVGNSSCSVSRVIVCNESYVRLIKPNVRPNIEKFFTKSYQVNDKFTLAKLKTRSISTTKLNFAMVQAPIVIPVPKPKPKIISNVKIPAFINPLAKGKQRYQYLPEGLKFKDEKYVPTPIPNDPINDVIYVPAPIDTEEDLNSVFAKLEGDHLFVNRDDIYECDEPSFRKWVTAVEIRNLF